LTLSSDRVSGCYLNTEAGFNVRAEGIKQVTIGRSVAAGVVGWWQIDRSGAFRIAIG
jgi:hypothetical protein